jgi:hypothetical protein
MSLLSVVLYPTAPPCTTWYCRISASCSSVRFAAPSFWKASLLGQKIVTSERASRGSTRLAAVAAPARAVKLPARRVAEMLRGMRRSLSMMWMMPLENSMSLVFDFSLVTVILVAG